MSRLSTASASSKDARTTRDQGTIHVVDPQGVKIISHRQVYREEYLILWQADGVGSTPSSTVVSWHSVAELTLCLDLVQSYIQQNGPFPPAKTTLTSTKTAATTTTTSKKRKAPGADVTSSARDTLELQLLTPRGSTQVSRSQSPLTTVSISPSFSPTSEGPRVYNGVLQKREGRITATQCKRPSVAIIDVTTLPTPDMVETARATPVTGAEQAIWNAFAMKLKAHSRATRTWTRVENRIDRTSPVLAFTFISGLVFGQDTYKTNPGTVEGCSAPCRPNMGGSCGCEYTKKCSCLEYAAVDESALARQDTDKYEEYLRRQEAGEDTFRIADLPRQFPYSKPSEDRRIPSTLRKHYRETRNVIYECNESCNCGPICKSRLVQKGRRVPLTIFKTANRGWGVYCDEDLVLGEFIDTYIGQVITAAEADRREDAVGIKNKSSYLYVLDKFVGERGVTLENCFIIDGEHMGGPTRFINHSCEPNCRQYAVSYNKNDLRVYDIAFFAYDNIRKGTELTFDYQDRDEMETEDVLKERERNVNDPEYHDKIPCNCGTEKCRGYLWI